MFLAPYRPDGVLQSLTTISLCGNRLVQDTVLSLGSLPRYVRVTATQTVFYSHSPESRFVQATVTNRSGKEPIESIWNLDIHVQADQSDLLLRRISRACCPVASRVFN